MLQDYPEDFIAGMLASLNPALAQSVLERFPHDQRQKVIAGAAPETRKQWIRNERYPENSIGHMMEPALAVFHPETTVAEATRELRHFVTRAFITYIFVVDDKERLRGVVAMRLVERRKPGGPVVRGCHGLRARTTPFAPGASNHTVSTSTNPVSRSHVPYSAGV